LRPHQGGVGPAAGPAYQRIGGERLENSTFQGLILEKSGKAEDD